MMSAPLPFAEVCVDEGTFSAVPAGLAQLTIAAPDFPVASRVAPVDADLDADHPTTTAFDFRLSLDDAFDPSEGSALIEAAVGGSVETPDGRLRLDIPPGSLTGDGLITIRRAPSPQSVPGMTLASDPELALPPLSALSEEIEILVDAPPDGEKPLLVGPVFVVARYFEAVAEALETAEASAFPYLHTGSDWTAQRILPYLHAVDRINNVVVAGLLFGETETGRGVVAYQTQKRPLLLAQAGSGSFQSIFLDAFRLVVGGVRRAVSFNPAVDLIEIKNLDEFSAERPEAPFFPINTASQPLLVVHGWDPLSSLRDSQLITDPLADPRYGQMLRDLVAMTNAVYRPIWLTYNTRLGIVPNGETLAAALRDRYPDPSSTGLLGPDFDRRPIDATQSPKQFGTFDSFGFSMGGLVARTYQLGSFFADPPPTEFVGGDPQGRLAHMVAMATPHHGALQLLRIVVSGTDSLVLKLQLEQLLSLWSPGTVDLLDYVDDDRISCDFSGNPSLCLLNLDLRSAPIVETGLIAGTKSTQRLASSIDLDLGVLAVPGVPSDSVVPVSSAHGESTIDRRLVPALRKRKTTTQVFDHLHAGTDASAQGEGNQRISEFADTDILPTLRDHWVIRERGLVADEPIFGPGLVVDRCPTPTEPGRIRADFSFDWKATRGELTGLALVTYVEDEAGQWSILHGADPRTGALDSELLLVVEGNSISIPRENTPDRQIRFDDALLPGIDARRTTTFFVTTGARKPTTAPLQPSAEQIERAETLGRIHSCR
jgi:hypothetical protein